MQKVRESCAFHTQSLHIGVGASAVVAGAYLAEALAPTAYKKIASASMERQFVGVARVPVDSQVEPHLPVVHYAAHACCVGGRGRHVDMVLIGCG